jgi:ubiquinone/menaquinone biosynthesis C-methylase UbiE
MIPRLQEKLMRNRQLLPLLSAVAVAVGLASGASAQLGSRTADEWIKLLEAPARVEALKVDEIVGHLGLKSGDVVADLGAGTGVFSVPIARIVGPTGKVYAVEVDQALVDYIAKKVKAQQIANVQTVLGRFADPALPASDVDLAFIHDVLHHIESRAEYLKQVARYLKPGGRIAIVEPDAQKGSHSDNPKLQITKEQLRTWMTAAGLTESNEFPLGEARWYVIYTRK